MLIAVSANALERRKKDTETLENNLISLHWKE